MPLSRNHTLLITPLRFLDTRLKAGKFLRLRPRREIIQLAEFDLPLFRDHQRLDVFVDRRGKPHQAATSAGALFRASIAFFEFSPPVASARANRPRAAQSAPHERRKQVDGPFFFNYTATTEIYTLSLHVALPL